ncbi:SURF1 family protein [Stenotrophomonas maltophilia]|uniref:SURF1 family protein n=1 Tax=Stenotrophomonas maltophilia TaxID=40324 RepID=UPI0034DB004A
MMRQHTRLVGWLMALLAMAGFTALGLWQLQRMHAKQALLDAQAPALAQAWPLAQALAAPGTLHGVADHGRFLPGVVLLDNQMRHGRAGVKIYRPFRSDDGSVLLVDLGWRALPADRSLPDVPPPPSPVAVRGLLAPPPAAGLALGPAFSATGQTDRWLASRLPADGLARALGLAVLPDRVLRLDPALPFGDERDLDLLPNTLPPQRHLGYAVQWFGLALTVLIVALVLEWRRRSRITR